MVRRRAFRAPGLQRGGLHFLRPQLPRHWKTLDFRQFDVMDRMCELLLARVKAAHKRRTGVLGKPYPFGWDLRLSGLMESQWYIDYRRHEVRLKGTRRRDVSKRARSSYGLLQILSYGSRGRLDVTGYTDRQGQKRLLLRLADQQIRQQITRGRYKWTNRSPGKTRLI